MAPFYRASAMLLLFCILICSSKATAAGEAPTHLHFYFHENFSAGPNGTTVTVAAPRTNGSYFGASLSDGALLTTLNFVFTEGPYNGSSLALFGRGLLGTVMERPIVGGTGAFRMARGYTLSKMLASPDPNSQLILEYDAYIWH
ncbi:unnamed protein product [Urochloa decumbens]|uniref:Dirigent protein n=1 Tax=Urochloa decumbens TaxID=240449 RepID=A0ABC8XCX0_9POAL